MKKYTYILSILLIIGFLAACAGSESGDTKTDTSTTKEDTTSVEVTNEAKTDEVTNKATDEDADADSASEDVAAEEAGDSDSETTEETASDDTATETKEEKTAIKAPVPIAPSSTLKKPVAPSGLRLQPRSGGLGGGIRSANPKSLAGQKNAISGTKRSLKQPQALPLGGGKSGGEK